MTMNRRAREETFYGRVISAFLHLCSTGPTFHSSNTLYDCICMVHRMYDRHILFLQRRENLR